MTSGVASGQQNVVVLAHFLSPESGNLSNPAGVFFTWISLTLSSMHFCYALLTASGQLERFGGEYFIDEAWRPELLGVFRPAQISSPEQVGCGTDIISI
ncbi:MAG: hypothetical protein EOP06_00775 [Proteobacteria bacterium]|jgi:hypothetical protein|nr:MAG: hypothetical protein EOP06_00775 [Pseudomonadota bacterium]